MLNIFPQLTDLEIEKVVETEQTVQLVLSSNAPEVACPLCANLTSRVQSRYSRRLDDLPLSNRQVLITLVVRRFYCTNLECKRRIFAERFTNLVQPYAQRTGRLNQSLRQIGLVVGGEGGARLAKKLGMFASPDTFLRLIRRNYQNNQNQSQNEAEIKSAKAEQDPLVNISIDDWSWKRGVRYGTIIVNLDNHDVVDLLPDRTSQSVSEWLKKHPNIKIISRDRASEYSLGASLGAPQATQVADRFHLVDNLVGQAEAILARLRKEWRPQLEVDPQELAQAKKVVAKELSNPASWKPARSRQTQRNHQARRAQREDRYNQVIQLKEAGLTNQQIAQRSGLSERTVRKWLKSPAFPEIQTPLKRRSVFDPYAQYVLKRWQEGQHDGHQLWQEISRQGYKGSERTVQRFVSQLRNEKRQPLSLPPASPLEGLKARQVVWWFIRDEVKLKEGERENLKNLLTASPQLNTLYQLIQSFMQLVHQLEGNRLEEWLVAARTSGFEELASYVRGIEQDKAAVVAGLTLPYSSGPTEGQNNRLKLIKRAMYGRGKLDLLRERVLARAA